MKSHYLKLFWWYCKRPGMYRDLARRMLAMGAQKKSAVDEQAASRVWCEGSQTTRAHVFKELSLTPSDTFEEVFKKKIETRLQELVDRKIVMGGGGDYSLLYAVAESLSAKRVVETGVAMGYSSLALLLSLSKRDGMLFSTDRPYPLKDYDKYVGHLVSGEFRSNWKLFRMPDKDGLKKVFRLCDQFDLIHYDSDKSKDGRLWGYQQLWSRLRTGGIFISDDIADNLAFKEFCESINKVPLVLKKGRNYVGIIGK